MARPNAMRSIEGESNLAKRIAVERQSREWSYDTLAKKMTESGCSINASAIFKIEKGDPPRKISVDELLAFAKVFGTDVDDLLTPIEVYRKARGKEILRELDDAKAKMAPAIAGLVDAYFAYFDLAAWDPELREFVDNHQQWVDVAEQEGGGEPLFEVEMDGGRVVVPDQTKLRQAIVGLHLAIIETAGDVYEDTALKGGDSE